MHFEEYIVKRDSNLFFENAGTSQSDIRLASKAMSEWVKATYSLLEAVDKVPEAFGALGGAVSDQNSLGENTPQHELTLEIQRAKYVMAEANLADLMSRMNQHAARIAHACEQI